MLWSPEPMTSATTTITSINREPQPRLYCGMTNSVARERTTPRLSWLHCKLQCHRLVWFEHYQYVHNALAREKQIKSWTRAKKIELIEGTNPSWSDLSESWRAEDCRSLDFACAPVGMTRSSKGRVTSANIGSRLQDLDRRQPGSCLLCNGPLGHPSEAEGPQLLPSPSPPSNHSSPSPPRIC